MSRRPSRTVHITSLGCAKNRVDSEVLLGLLRQAGYEHVDDAAQAELLVINTCGFIEAAREESVDAVLEAAALKRTGRCRTLLVAGCLVQRHAAELARALPEVDKLVGTANLHEIVSLLQSDERVAAEPRASFLYDHTYTREPSLGPHTAYVKVAEGCDRPCAFCAVPAIRGAQQSRTIESVVEEVASLVARGVVEINLVAQDLTAYGRDSGMPSGLAALVRALRSVPDLTWLRLLYAYPSEIDEALLAELSAGLPVVPYLDVPLQHVDDAVLRAMRRGYGESLARELTGRLRSHVPGIRLRSTLLVGHPGETEEAFERLLAWVEETRFDHLGVFAYSREEGTAACAMAGQVPEEVAGERAAQVMEVQRRVSRELNQTLVGERVEVLVEGRSPETELLLAGRHAGQAPEVDGIVHLADVPGDAQPGHRVVADIEQASDYDLVGRFVARVPA